jgi:hypothetical protein
LDSLASADSFATALIEIYYIGQTNVALDRLWQTHSTSSATIINTFNLIYTDVIAAAVVNTKSSPVRLSMSNDNGNSAPNSLTLVKTFEQ